MTQTRIRAHPLRNLKRCLKKAAECKLRKYKSVPLVLKARLNSLKESKNIFHQPRKKLR